jgi:hypothetical protein
MEPLGIEGVITSEVGQPTNDGSPGSALYRVPVRLTRAPDALEAGLMVQNWDSPPRFTTMHRPGIARVVEDQVVLDGPTIEEVRDYHASTLALAIEVTNDQAHEIRLRQQRDDELESKRRSEHERHVDKTAGEITFD